MQKGAPPNFENSVCHREKIFLFSNSAKCCAKYFEHASENILSTPFPVPSQKLIHLDLPPCCRSLPTSPNFKINTFNYKYNLPQRIEISYHLAKLLKFLRSANISPHPLARSAARNFWRTVYIERFSKAPARIDSKRGIEGNASAGASAVTVNPIVGVQERIAYRRHAEWVSVSRGRVASSGEESERENPRQTQWESDPFHLYSERPAASYLNLTRCYA